MGPQEGGRGKAQPRWFGEGAGRLAPGLGKGTSGGGARDPGPQQLGRPPPASQPPESQVPFLRASSPRASITLTAHARGDPCPTRRGGADRPEPQSAPAGGDTGVEGGGDTHPGVCPQSPRGRPDPPPRYLASRVLAGGLLHKEEVVEGDAKSLRGGIHFGHLGREEREKKKRETGNGRKKGGPSELGQRLAGREGDAIGRPGPGLSAPAGVCGGKVDRPGSPAPDAYEVARVQARVGVRLPGFGVRWVSGRGGWEGGREGRGGGPQPCRSLGRREGRNLW